jgi:hypothetical protein
MLGADELPDGGTRPARLPLEVLGCAVEANGTDDEDDDRVAPADCVEEATVMSALSRISFKSR